jgi:hypothetical protein
MSLPNDTTIEQLAKVFEVTTTILTPAAHKLTKGDLMHLNGATDDVTALRTYAAHGAPALEVVEKNARTAKLTLSVEDLSSIQRVFGSPSVPDSRLRELDKDVQIPDIHIYACCCPCCCATAVISPNRNGVA